MWGRGRGKAEPGLKPDPSCVITPNTHLLGVLLARPGTSAYRAGARLGSPDSVPGQVDNLAK